MHTILVDVVGQARLWEYLEWKRAWSQFISPSHRQLVLNKLQFPPEMKGKLRGFRREKTSFHLRMVEPPDSHVCLSVRPDVHTFTSTPRVKEIAFDWNSLSRQFLNPSKNGLLCYTTITTLSTHTRYKSHYHSAWKRRRHIKLNFPFLFLDENPSLSFSTH